MNAGYTAPSLTEIYATNNLALFKDALRSTKRNNAAAYSNLSSSLSKSPRWEGTTHAPASVINRRDPFGRTALHLAASSLDTSALEYISLMLESPHINVNLQDAESGWTALHRALYAGNLAAARIIATHPNCDMTVKDHEGLSPLDVWNATIEGTNPVASTSSGVHGARADLFTWGSNRDFVLGFSNNNDRQLPERVPLKQRQPNKTPLPGPVKSQKIVMSKFATGVVTTEGQGNVRFCGLGYAGGKLGKAGQARFALEPIGDFRQKVVAVALGLDHTVILTASGEVFTYGMNHFGQLGYALDAIKSGEEPIQSTPRRVTALKKETIHGIAASKYHTVCCSADALYTFGANKGQLGYASSAVQVQPRQVSNVPGRVNQVVASDLATVCLLDTGEVFVLFRSTSFKMSFPMNRFPMAIKVYRPPTQTFTIAKLAAGGSDILAISDAGDAFLWKLDDTVVDSATAARSPVRLWDRRRKFTAIVDAAVFNDSVILCTRSGHVYVREQRKEGRKKFKFRRIPFLQRVVAVATNGFGAYAAVRADVPVPRIPSEDSSLSRDLLSVLPHWSRLSKLDPAVMGLAKTRPEDLDEESLQRDAVEGIALCQLASNWDATYEEPLHGSDMSIHVADKKIPVHFTVLICRSPVLRQLLLEPSANPTSSTISYDSKQRILTIRKTSVLVTLLLVHYLYSDNFPCLWDPRIVHSMRTTFPYIAFPSVREELQRVSHLLQLPALGRVCGALEKVFCAPTLAQDLAQIQPTLNQQAANTGQDIEVLLKNNSIQCHSVVLRARCPFFAALLDDPTWTMERRATSHLYVDLTHIEAEGFDQVLRYIYADAGQQVFDLSRAESTDKAIDHIVSVMAISDELMIDQLKTLCSQALVPFVDLRTAGAILQDADTFHASALADACGYYLCCNMETAMESGYIANLSLPLLQRLATYGRTRQCLRLPLTRSDVLVSDLKIKHAGWLAEQDFAKPPTGLPHRARQIAKSPVLSPSSLTPSPFLSARSPITTSNKSLEEPSPVLLPDRQPDDDLFEIEDLELSPPEKPSIADALTFTKRSWESPASASPSPSSLRQIMASQTGSPIPARNQPYRPPMRNPSGSAPLDAVPDQPRSWGRTPATPSKVSLLSIQAQQQTQGSQKRSIATPSPTPSPARPSPARASPVNPSPLARSDPRSAVGASVISPVRMASSGSASSSLGKPRNQDAWVNYTSTSSFFVPSSPTPSSGVSFSAIQNAQQDEGDLIRNLRKAPRSLAEIQQEEEFELWFQNEQRKYQEQVSADLQKQQKPPKSSRRGRGQGRGRGRGSKPAGSGS